MTTEITVAIIALIGVMFSALVSYLVSHQETSTAMRQVREERIQEIGVTVLEKRIELYPELYGYLSTFFKTMKFGTLSPKAVKNLFSQLDKWSQQNAIFYSESTDYISYQLYKELARLKDLSDQQLRKELESNELQTKLAKMVIALKLGLQRGLGTRPFTTPISTSEFKLEMSYDERDKYYQNLLAALPNNPLD